MQDSQHISEPINEIFLKFRDNNEKIEYMAKHFGQRYYEMFGRLIMDENYEIQDAIDKCYEYFSR